MSRTGERTTLACAVLTLASMVSGPGASAAGQIANEPEVRSAAALIADARTGEVLFERKATQVTPIASITKLMTALVVLDGKQPLDEVVVITADDKWSGKGA